jgi:hypothetical protein
MKFQELTIWVLFCLGAFFFPSKTLCPEIHKVHK